MGQLDKSFKGYYVIREYKGNALILKISPKNRMKQTSKGRKFADSAMRGGIDLNSKNMAMSVSGDKIDIKFDPAMVAQFQRGDFSGVRPQILSITPIASVYPLLGLKEETVKVS